MADAADSAQLMLAQIAEVRGIKAAAERLRRVGNPYAEGIVGDADRMLERLLTRASVCELAPPQIGIGVRESVAPATRGPSPSPRARP